MGWVVSLHAMLKQRQYLRIYYDGAWVHERKNGVVVDRRINNELSLTKSVSEAEDFWTFVYKPGVGDTVFDVGAGIGEETYYFSQMVGPRGRVISVEAHPDTFYCLRKLCDYNKLENVTALNLAIQGDESEAVIDDPKAHIASTIVDTTSGVRVPGTTLDQLVGKLGVSTIDFLKLNIEGAEKLALAGMTDTIKRTRNICVSCHDFMAERHGNEGMRTKTVVHDFLLKNNFRIVKRDDDERDWIRDQLNGINQDLA